MTIARTSTWMIAALLAVACERESNSNTAASTATPAAKTGSSNAPVKVPATTATHATAATPTTPSAPAAPAAPAVPDEPPVRIAPDDPEKGNFTLEEALKDLPGKGKLWAKITTTEGVINCELFSDKAPVTVASFVGLARGLRPFYDAKTKAWIKQPYFDGLAFHRVIPKFMIQGGDQQSRNYASRYIGQGGPGYALKNEIAKDLTFDKPGMLAMANAGPDTGGSQFFITEEPKAYLNGGYTIFGQCDAPDVVKKIARVPRAPGDKPLTAVTMKVEISRK